MKSVKDLKEAARFLEIVAVGKEHAMTCREIAERFFGKRGTDISGEDCLTDSELRKVQRHLKNLSQPEDGQPILINLVAETTRSADVRNRRTYRYYLRPTALNQWLMSEKSALDLILTQQILSRSFAGALSDRSHSSTSDVMAESVANMDVQTKRLRACLRVVPDWFGRVPAEIKPQILKEVINAIATDRQFQFEYTSAAGNSKIYTVSPRGLVAKDWSIYLLSTRSTSDMPGPALPLHRMTTGSCTAKPRDIRSVEFDLDAHIEDTHQFAHPLGSQPETFFLELKVAAETIYHFRERKISRDQIIDGPDREDGSYLVRATVVDTILLIPFLVSMLEGIEVVGPQSIRNEMAEHLEKMVTHYKT